MGDLFGTDGIRGLAVENVKRDSSAITRCIDDREFSVGLLQLVGEALGTYLRPSGEGRPRVVIGWDQRPLNEDLVRSLTVGLHLSNCSVTWAGECATPGLHATLLAEGADTGCMVTASHNPVSDSGIKIFDKDGYKTSPKVESAIEALIHQLSSEERELSEDEKYKLGIADQSVDGAAIHSAALTLRLPMLKLRYLDGLVSSLFPPEGLLLDSSKGSATTWLADWLSENLVKTEELSADCLALNEGCGAGELSPTLAMTWDELSTKEHNHVLFDELNKRQSSYNIGEMILAAALDGDGDRCLLVRVNSKATGIEVVDGDQMLDVLAMAASEISPQIKGMVAASIESDLSLLNSLQRLDAEFEAVETAVGDRWLAVALRDNLTSSSEPFRIGGEDSGHILLTTPHPIQDDEWRLVGDGVATLVASICALTTCSEKQGFPFGWKSRQSISPSERSKWDGKNENAEAVIALLEGDWQRQEIDGESNLLMMKGKINGDKVSVAVRNSGTQAKTTVSIRSTGTHLSDLLEEVIQILTPRLQP